jgi:hypothetical protein
MIRVTLPTHLRDLARVTGAVTLQLEAPVTQRSILDALETTYPMLRGTIRDPATKERRPFIRFFACGEDLSHESIDAAVPGEVASGVQPFRIIGAMAGG